MAKIPVKDARSFVAADRKLDLATSGPRWLTDASVASAVSNTIVAAATSKDLCELYSYVVMPNHVHVLLHPLVDLANVTRWIKGVSAREANLILGRTGQTFWQDESFDHWVRSSFEFDNIIRYIENNPVKAGLVTKPEFWAHSSAASDLPFQLRSTG